MPATTEVNRALLARLEQLLGQYDQVRAGVADARTRVRLITGTAKSADGGIRVTVSPRGALTDLAIDPRTYRKSSPTELAGAILELAAAATRDVTWQAAEIMRPYLPRDLPFADIVNGTAELTTMPPAPLTEQTFDEWWAGIGRPHDSETPR